MTTTLLVAAAFGLGLVAGWHLERNIGAAVEQRRIRRELAKWRAAGRK